MEGQFLRAGVRLLIRTTDRGGRGPYNVMVGVLVSESGQECLCTAV